MEEGQHYRLSFYSFEVLTRELYYLSHWLRFLGSVFEKNVYWNTYKFLMLFFLIAFIRVIKARDITL